MISMVQQSFHRSTLNALYCLESKGKYKKVVSGAGSALACANLYVLLGINPNIIMFDKDGVLSQREQNYLLYQNKVKSIRNYLGRGFKRRRCVFRFVSRRYFNPDVGMLMILLFCNGKSRSRN
jgi:hypothetical protein